MISLKKCGTDLRLCGGVLGLGGVRSLASFTFLSPSLGGVLGLNGAVTSVLSLPAGEVFVCGGVFGLHGGVPGELGSIASLALNSSLVFLAFIVSILSIALRASLQYSQWKCMFTGNNKIQCILQSIHFIFCMNMCHRLTHLLPFSVAFTTGTY